MERHAHTDSGESTGLSEDEVHRLLAVERRRLALEILVGGGPRGLEGLAEAIVERERDDARTECDVRETMVDLYHSHLPLMADLGVIEFDRRGKRVVGRLVAPEVV